MIYELEKLRKEIQEKKNELDFAIINNSPRDVIYMKSINVDNAIAKYLKATTKYENENKRLMAKYKKILEKDYKKEIVDLITQEVSDKIKDISEDELNHFCNNVYVLCSLKAHNVEEQEIIKQLMYRNNVYLYEMQQKGKVLNNTNISNVKLDFYTYLKDKYIKIIKERM